MSNRIPRYCNECGNVACYARADVILASLVCLDCIAKHPDIIFFCRQRPAAIGIDEHNAIPRIDCQYEGVEGVITPCRDCLALELKLTQEFLAHSRAHVVLLEKNLTEHAEHWKHWQERAQGYYQETVALNNRLASAREEIAMLTAKLNETIATSASVATQARVQYLESALQTAESSRDSWKRLAKEWEVYYGRASR